MPNHIHGVLIISEDDSPVGVRHASPLQPRPPLGIIVGSFKSAVTKRINESRATPGILVWQRNYFEHVIRSERELNVIRQYILDNPLKWALDRDNPINAPRLSVSGTVDQYLRDVEL